MRPHLLELQAFGAFPGRVAVDFDALAAGGPVLLCGDTGSGKTTLLDALGFALFGQVPGERGKARDLRSHHAADDVPPEVRLTFSARGRRLRITRRPGWERPKRAGGTSRQQPSVLLEEQDGSRWTPLPDTRLDAVGLEVARLVGMTAEQFFQVVLLPQGRFAAFLHADHKDREALLKQLFRVSRFESAERWLADRAGTASAAAAAGRQEVAALVERVAQVDGGDLPQGEAPEVWLAGLVATGGAALERAVAGAAEAGRERTAAEEALAARRDLLRRTALRDEAERLRDALAARAADMAALRAAVAAAARARPIAPALEEVSHRRKGAVAAEAERLSAVATLPPELRDADEAALATVAAQGREELGALRGLEAIEAAAAVDERVADDAAGDAERLRDELLAVRARLAGQLPAAVEEAGIRLAAAQAAAVALPARLQEHATAMELVELAAGRDAAGIAAAAAEQALAQAAAATEVRAAEEFQVRVRRIEAAATELATYLEDGTPCPVCGSLQHPDPAELRPDDVTRDEERAAAAALRLAREAEQEVRGRHAALVERLRGVEERLAGRAVPGAAELAALEGAVRTLAGAAADAPVAEAAVATARRELGEAGARAAGLEAAVAAAALRGTEAAERAARSRGELDRVLCGVPLRERRAQVAARIGAAEAAGHATGRARLAARAAEAAQDALQALFASQGFAAAADAAAAIRSPERLDADEAAVRRYDDDLAAVRARLADPELAVDPGAPVDLCGAETGVEEAAKRHEAAVTEVGLLRERARQLDALVPRLAAAVAALGPLSARAESVRALAEVVAGRAGNRLQMPLATFVLAARLEEVAKAASARLLRMTSGRYCLLHTDASRDRRSRAGLALEVEDAWTGRRRDTATLSGGETFMTALALALGLADVVTAEAGGSTIDALFVDEGFGSLDPDSLDQVMGVLDELRSSGRLVGLVSHVAELRQRIPAQVLVRRGRAGSDVTVSWL